jgi:acetyltransferase EpsM
MEQPLKQLLILGTRTYAVKQADMISEIPGFRVAGFVENMEPERCRERLEGLPIIWVEEVAKLAENHWAVCALSTTHRSKFTDQVAGYGVPFATVVHPTASVSSRSSLGEGTIVSANAVISAHAKLGRHVLVDSGALIGHHTDIGDYVTVGLGAKIAGCSRIGRAAYIAMGAIVLERLEIGAHSVVGAGSVVTKDVPDNVQVLGSPAKIVKRDIEGR